MQPIQKAHDMIARSSDLAAADRDAIARKNADATMKRATNVRYWTEVAAEIERIRGSKGLWVVLANVGNPDHGQDPRATLPGVLNAVVPAKDFAHASRICRAYIHDNELGGGNWSGGRVFKAGKAVAEVSYNGRVWELPKRAGAKPVWPLEPGDGQKKAYDPCAIAWETARIRVEGVGPIEITGSYRTASANLMEGWCTVDGKEVEGSISLAFTRDGVEVSDISFLEDGDFDKGFTPSPAIRRAIAQTFAAWYEDPANKAMILRNECEDARQRLAVQERNIGYKKAELEKMEEEAAALRVAHQELEAEVAAAAVPTPRM